PAQISSFFCQPGHCQAAQGDNCASVGSSTPCSVSSLSLSLPASLNLPHALTIMHFYLLCLQTSTSCPAAGIFGETSVTNEETSDDPLASARVFSCCGQNRQCPGDNLLCGKCTPSTYEWKGACVSCDDDGAVTGLIILMVLACLGWMIL